MRAWIGGPAFDGVFILGPAYGVSALVWCFPAFFVSHDITPLLWAALIVGVDVAHVYSTLYRTYFDPLAFQQRRTLLLMAPLLGYLGFAALYSLGAMVFWRTLAYLAVFHFIRQQYGFMMIYRRNETGSAVLDRAAIYAATLYPVVWWHCHPRRFAWFIEGDFFQFASAWIAQAALAAYLGILTAYGIAEVRAWRRTGRVNLPRNLLLAGTALSWWTGIVMLDSDLAFTATNVLAHGIPYIALIWLYGRHQSRIAPARRLLCAIPMGRFYSLRFVPLFLALPMLFAYVEEGLWDGFVWSEHPGLFRAFTVLPAVDNSDILVWLLPLLALPQITHYLLDAFIWRLHRPEAAWTRVMFGGSGQTSTP